MTTRRAKQLIYGALYLIILLCVIGIFYVIFIRPFTSAPAAVCTPSSCAPTSTAPITVSPVSMFVTSPGHYTFLTQVLDTNASFGVQPLNYEIDVYDASDTLLGSVPAQSFIYPTESKYLVVPNIATSAAIDHATLKIDGGQWAASSTLGAIPNFSQQNVESSENSSTVTVSGQLTNSDLGSYQTVEVVVVFSDANGNPVGASQTELQNVQPQSTVNFSVSYPTEPNIDPAKYQVFVYGLR